MIAFETDSGDMALDDVQIDDAIDDFLRRYGNAGQRITVRVVEVGQSVGGFVLLSDRDRLID
jgi:hypothetical protein